MTDELDKVPSSPALDEVKSPPSSAHRSASQLLADTDPVARPLGAASLPRSPLEGISRLPPRPDRTAPMPAVPRPTTVAPLRIPSAPPRSPSYVADSEVDIPTAPRLPDGVRDGKEDRPAAQERAGAGVVEIEEAPRPPSFSVPTPEQTLDEALDELAAASVRSSDAAFPGVASPAEGSSAEIHRRGSPAGVPDADSDGVVSVQTAIARAEAAIEEIAAIPEIEDAHVVESIKPPPPKARPSLVPAPTPPAPAAAPALAREMPEVDGAPVTVRVSEVPVKMGPTPAEVFNPEELDVVSSGAIAALDGLEGGIEPLRTPTIEHRPLYVSDPPAPPEESTAPLSAPRASVPAELDIPVEEEAPWTESLRRASESSPEVRRADASSTERATIAERRKSPSHADRKPSALKPPSSLAQTGAPNSAHVSIAPGAAAAALGDEKTARKKGRPWWEELFNDDYIRTMASITDGQIGHEVDFIEDSLNVAQGAMVLDLACGTGLHAIELTKRGYQVVGFDLSLPMLARAADEAQDRAQKLNFVQGDMREMSFEDIFDGVYSWNTSFGFFEEEKNAQVVQRVHRALKKGGQFLLDVGNRDFIVRQSPSLVWFEGEGCICMDEMQVDWITSRLRVKRTMMLDDGRSKEIEYSVRLYALHELGKLLHDAGFRVVEVSGRPSTPGVFFGADSPRTLILAEKK